MGNRSKPSSKKHKEGSQTARRSRTSRSSSGDASPRRKKKHPAELLALSDVMRASERVAETVKASPLLFSSSLSELSGREVFLKCDHFLHTGSFKERGVAHFLEADLIANNGKRSGERTYCAASAGNHALALSYHCNLRGFRAKIIMPVNAPLIKQKMSRHYGAEIVLHGESFNEAYAYAQQLSEENNYQFVPAFNHNDIILGQSSSGFELVQQLSDFDSVIVAVGGGGYISGVAGALHVLRKKTYVLGVQSQWAIEHKSASASPPVSKRLTPGSIADGIAVKGIGELNQRYIDHYVDKMCSVSETELSHALVEMLSRQHMVVEGACAAPLAALLKRELPKRCKRVVLFLGGSNIDPGLLARILQFEQNRQGQLVRARLSVADRPGSLSFLTAEISQLGVNVLEIDHNRSFAKLPSTVEITALLEVRDLEHQELLLSRLASLGLEVSTDI